MRLLTNSKSYVVYSYRQSRE